MGVVMAVRLARPAPGRWAAVAKALAPAHPGPGWLVARAHPAPRRAGRRGRQAPTVR